MIQELLNERKLPALKTREEMLKMLAEEEYGFMPKKPVSISVEETNAGRNDQCAGHAEYREYTLTAQMEGYSVSFPIRCVFPTKLPEGGAPAFVYINFRPEVPDWYFPAEEIIDSGCAVASIYYNDVAMDAEDGFVSGISPEIFAHEGKTSTISLWAWACSRALDFLLTREDIDHSRIAVVGHSRLGKTALWAGANDERFAMVVSNDSGCSGAAISRGKIGESIERITRVFPRWFHSTNYAQYGDREFEAPFDQHFLLACVAPRKLAVGSASEDSWADPDSEYLGCCAASKMWEDMGLTGFVHPDRLPEIGDSLQEGNIAYHLREGAHYISRTDWQQYIRFLKK